MTMGDMSIAEAKVLVASWATHERLIQRIYFFAVVFVKKIDPIATLILELS